MKTLPAQLTPFIRSDALGALLAQTLGFPDQENSLADLGRLTGVSAPVVHREVSRLVETSILLDRQVGRNRMVRANRDHPLFTHMHAIIMATYGPVPVLQEIFTDVIGVDQLYIYGSWAARFTGEAGPYPNDLDVLTIGDTSQRVLSAKAATASHQLGITVNITRLTIEQWESDTPSPFVQTLRSHPLVQVI
ncbi:MAG: hypothetical protein Q4G30_01735 [Actinomycetaceae bacterium]|nr:hypothetical protein [Actinomycetaceae bacterium]